LIIFVSYISIQAAVRGGISLAGVISYQLEPIASARMCASSCAATLQACSELYASRPGNYIEIYAWYQTRRVKMCRGRIWGRSFVSNACSKSLPLLLYKISYPLILVFCWFFPQSRVIPVALSGEAGTVGIGLQ